MPAAVTVCGLRLGLDMGRAFLQWRQRSACCRCYAGRRPEDVTIRMSNASELPACPYSVACAWLQ